MVFKVSEEEERENRERLELSEDAPQIFHTYTLDDREILYTLFFLMANACLPNKSVYSGDKVSFRVPWNKMAPLATNLAKSLKTKKTKKANKYNREELTHVEQLEWNIEEEKQLSTFLSIFKNLRVPLEVAWLKDRGTKTKKRKKPVKIVDPSKLKFMNSMEESDLNKYKALLEDYDIELVEKHLCLINIGVMKNTGHLYRLKIVYTRDLPYSGILKFSFSISKFVNGMAQDIIAQGEAPSAKTDATNETPNMYQEQIRELNEASRQHIEALRREILHGLPSN